MSIALRQIRKEEYEAARALWDIVFPDDAAGYSAYYFSKRTMPEAIYAAFDGDFASWAEIPAFPVDEIETDLESAAYMGNVAPFRFDMDYDAADEGVSLLVALDAALRPLVVFASWRGDKYTADKGVCYLGWVEGGTARLAATWCGKGAGVMYCAMPASGEGAPTCELCDSADGACAACSMGGRLDSCLPKESIAGSVDLDVDIDFDLDGDL